VIQVSAKRSSNLPNISISHPSPSSINTHNNLKNHITYLRTNPNLPTTFTMSEAPYDPYLGGAPAAGGAAPAQSNPGNQRTAALQAQIDDTVGVMRENINKVSQRGERLDSLQDKTDNLAVSAQGFRRGANRVRKQMWWKGSSRQSLLN